MPRIDAETGKPILRNPFRDKLMRLQYETVVKAYDRRHRDLFLSNGERRTAGYYGSSLATYFWHGYDGVNADKWDAPSRRMIAYALWCAGRDVRKRDG